MTHVKADADGVTEILRVLLEHPDADRLGGDRRRITVLFSDIRGYTTLSENLSPEAVVGWLNEYFNAQVGVIHAHRGTVAPLTSSSATP